MKISDEIRELILAGASSMSLKQEAIGAGMCTLRRSALRCLQDGVTSLEEVLRVTTLD
jgi:type IV pilus assembly protein PilB